MDDNDFEDAEGSICENLRYPCHQRLICLKLLNTDFADNTDNTDDTDLIIITKWVY